MLFIYEGNSLKSGVYKIVNLINNRIYIGSAKEFKGRWKQHYYSLKANKHSNKFLQSDYNKCGEDAFRFEVIEVTSKDKKERLLLEEEYILKFYDKGQMCYNLCNRAVSREGCSSADSTSTRQKKSSSMKAAWKKMSPETKKRRSELISLAHSTQEAKDRNKKKWVEQNMQQYSGIIAGWNKGMKLPQCSGDKHHMYGKKHSEQTIEKIKKTMHDSDKSAWNKGVTGYKMPPCSDETKEKLRIANIGKKLNSEHKQKISESKKGKNSGKSSTSSKTYDGFILTSPSGDRYTKIECLTEFAKNNNLNMKCLWKLIKGKTKSTRGWKLTEEKIMDKEDELAKEVVNKDSELKEIFIDFVGRRLQPDNGEVTVEMCVEVFAQEFPEFLLLVAQENFLRGYSQCMKDVENAPEHEQPEA
jgi:group I intron endonuclease